jgi:hypothetical protein
MARLFCLGLKNTLWHFNVKSERVQGLKSHIPQELVNLPYEDARSIIFGAIDYAAQA